MADGRVRRPSQHLLPSHSFRFGKSNLPRRNEIYKILISKAIYVST
jgi:hypothetical protein